MGKVTRAHLAGLELAIDLWNSAPNVASFLAELRDSVSQASAAPEQEAVAEVKYMGYEPTNHLNWIGKNDLQLLKDGTKLYTHPSSRD